MNTMLTPNDFALIFPLLTTWHFLADYPLQGEWLAKAKNPRLQPVPGESIWFLAMMGHCHIHALGVYVITGSVVMACIEFILHGVIDILKCDKKISYNTDQALHIGLKFAYAFVYALPY